MRIKNVKAIHRLLIGFILSVAGYFLAERWNDESKSLSIMIAWVLFCVIILSLDWITFFTTSPSQIRQQAREQDESAIAIFVIVLISVVASLTGVFTIIVGRDDNAVLPLLSGIGGMIGSWCITHTLFALRYAHLYYGDDEEDASKHAGGLNFPEENEQPDFLDFAYFSFVIGMTFQVSDVEITNKRLRRLVLLHSLISFAFNTFIVALTINIIAGLSEK